MKTVFATALTAFLLYAAVKVGMAEGYLSALVFLLITLLLIGFVMGLADMLLRPFTHRWTHRRDD